MLFNSIDFAIFFPIVLLLYWGVFRNTLKGQNFLILVSSYVFYGWWDYRFLSLIVISTLVDFFVGVKLKTTENRGTRKILLWTSIIVNLGMLGYFKYYNFFVDSFIDAFQIFGRELSFSTLSIILPVGISFYTFQTLSYTIDIYRRKIEPTNDLLVFACFVSFFPQLVAGPIERAKNLMPQFTVTKSLNSTDFVEGLRQILWGLFKKIVVADQCAFIVQEIFSNTESYSSPFVILGVVFFAFQIYGDFSGYSDIAIGASRMLGYRLMRNFAYPYFSRDIAEFWRRWHISLSSWFRNYLYIPLGGSRVDSKWILIRNVIVVFLVSGFWHGADWKFIVWGFINGVYFLPYILLNRNRTHMDIVATDSRFPKTGELAGIMMTFAMTCFAWIFFRADSMSHAFTIIGSILDFDTGLPNATFLIKVLMSTGYIFILVWMEWVNRRVEYPFQGQTFSRTSLRWSYYLFLGTLIIMNSDSYENFIYFQF